MKKILRITFFSLLFLGAIAMIIWFLVMRRQVPQHAQCIPKNAIAVLTLNLRELALDHASGEHLFPEMADKKISKELERFSKALEKNDGSGVKETADVLGFLYFDGKESSFYGVSLSLKDSAKFGKLLREQLTKELLLRPFSSGGVSMMRFDTSGTVVGWNNDIALVLYPVGDHSATESSAQCIQLLKQSQEQSVLADENFREHELSSFDAGLWVQPEYLLKMTGGSSFLRTFFYNVKYLSLAMDFQDGELITRKIVTNEKVLTNVPYNAPLLISCDPKQVLGFYRGALDMQNDSLLKDYLDSPPLNALPLNDERTQQLSPYLDGNYAMLFHDTFSYNMDYITYDYDADFNRVPRHETKRETAQGQSVSFGLKDPNAARKLVEAWMQQDSIRVNGNTWMIEEHGATEYLMIADSMLTYSNWKQTDGKKRDMPESWQGLDGFFPLAKLIIPQLAALASFMIPEMGNAEQLLSAHVENLLISEPLVVGNVQSSQIRVTMKNKKVNALVQWEELGRKITEGN